MFKLSDIKSDTAFKALLLDSLHHSRILLYNMFQKYMSSCEQGDHATVHADRCLLLTAELQGKSWITS